MADVKRLNYFTFQFLVEKDFKDEQAYHREMRERHNQMLHSSGVASQGFAVTKTGDRKVTVSPGMAIDKDGKEIVLLDPREHTLATPPTNADVFLTIEHLVINSDDPEDHYTSGGVDNFTRKKERHKLADSTSQPSPSSPAITLAKLKLDPASGNINSIDASVRKLIGSAIAPGTVSQNHLDEPLKNLILNAPKGIASLEGVSSPGGNIDLVPGAGVLLTPKASPPSIDIGFDLGKRVEVNAPFSHNNQDGDTISTLPLPAGFQPKLVLCFGAVSTVSDARLGVFAQGGVLNGFSDLVSGFQQCIGIELNRTSDAEWSSTAFVDGIAEKAIAACRLIGKSAREDLRVSVSGVTAAGLRVTFNRSRPANFQKLPGFNIILHLLCFGASA